MAARDKIARVIKLANPAGPEGAVKQLFAGHRGCGKTSELFRLKEQLENDDFFVSYVDSALALDINDAGYTDVLLATMYGLVDDVNRDERGLGLSIPDSLVKSLVRRLGTLIVEDETLLDAETTASTTAEVGGGIPGFLKVVASLTARMKASAKRRSTLRQSFEPEISHFLSEFNDIVDHLRVQIEDRGLKGLVLIVDSLDRIIPKPSPSGGTSHTQIFINHAEHLKAPRCHIVYTVPISIHYESSLLPHYPNQARILPMVKVRDREGNDCEGALDTMVEAVKLRIDGRHGLREPGRCAATMPRVRRPHP